MLQPVPAAVRAQASMPHEVPELALRAQSLLGPLGLVTLAAAVGATVAHRIGLRSALAGDPGARPDLRAALVTGAALAVALAGVDAVLDDRLGPQWHEAAARAADAPHWPALPIGLLYGGLAEEVVMRWGLMSLVAWGLTRAIHHRAPGTSPLPNGVAWTAVVVCAFAFSAGHLPALAVQVEPTAPIVARTLALNLLAGIAYGWLFWRRGLETAMLAHASTHVGLALARSLP